LQPLGKAENVFECLEAFAHSVNLRFTVRLTL